MCRVRGRIAKRARSMWARVKGETENALLAMGFKAAYMFRPGLIVPLHGIKSKTELYTGIYTVMRPCAAAAAADVSEACDDDGAGGAGDAGGGEAWVSEAGAGGADIDDVGSARCEGGGVNELD